MADTVAIQIGPRDHGRIMPFEEFRRAEPAPGHNYELARGVVEVTDIPSRTHAQVVNEIPADIFPALKGVSTIADIVWIGLHRRHVNP